MRGQEDGKETRCQHAPKKPPRARLRLKFDLTTGVWGPPVRVDRPLRLLRREGAAFLFRSKTPSSSSIRWTVYGILAIGMDAGHHLGRDRLVGRVGAGLFRHDNGLAILHRGRALRAGSRLRNPGRGGGRPPVGAPGHLCALAALHRDTGHDGRSPADLPANTRTANVVSGWPDTLNALNTHRYFGTITATTAFFLLLVAGLLGISEISPRGPQTSTQSAANREVARLAGIPVRLYVIGVYTLSGTLAAVRRDGQCGPAPDVANPMDGLGYELTAIAAVVIGGASPFGRRRQHGRHPHRRSDHRRAQQRAQPDRRSDLRQGT